MAAPVVGNVRLQRMHPLRLYACGAVAFALIATVTSAQFPGFLNAVMDVYALAFVPLVIAILISGNAHMPSEFGFYIGFFLEWLVVSLIVAIVFWLMQRKRSRVAT